MIIQYYNLLYDMIPLANDIEEREKGRGQWADYLQWQ